MVSRPYLTGDPQMADRYVLTGPIGLEGLTAEQVLTFLAPVLEAIPADSMDTTSFQVLAQGGAGAPQSQQVQGANIAALKAGFEELKAALQAKPGEVGTSTTPPPIVYGIRGAVNLVNLAYHDGVAVIEAA